MESRGPLKDQTLRIIRDRNVPVSTVLDVGVLHGTPELATMWRDRKHILFEPVEDFETSIRQNYRNIEFELHKVAVADQTGVATLKVMSNLPGKGVSHSTMVSDAQDNASGLRSVPKITLDDFLADRDDLLAPYLLKIDIDGHELQVIRGAAETLKRCSVVIIECPRQHLVERISAVQSAGFTLFDLTEPCYYDKVFWQCDAVFIRNDLAATVFKPLQGKVEPGMYECYRG